MKRGKLFFRNKKGVSPLIATVLLIAFAVALGAIVMSWGKSYITQTQTDVQNKGNLQMTCSEDVGINILSIAGSFDACYKDTDNTSVNGTIKFTLKNSGSEALAGLKVQIITDKNVTLKTISKDLEPGDIYHAASIEYPGNQSFKELVINPEIKVGSETKVCANSEITLDTSQIKTCS